MSISRTPRVLLLDSNESLEKQGRTPTLNHGVDLKLTGSGPNMFPPGSELIETPIGVGLGTCLQVRNNLHLIEQKNRAERNRTKLVYVFRFLQCNGLI